MMDLVQNYLTDFTHWNAVAGQSFIGQNLSHFNLAQFGLSDLPMPYDWAADNWGAHNWATVATKIKETDLSGDVGKWWDKVVKTGQVWAFLLGAIFGYLVKTFTTYG
jgi:hypothetical protein